MSGHTKGPWEVARTDAGIIVRTESAKKTRFGASRYAAIGGFDRSDPEQLAEALANARLIAAAPDLLEALEMGPSILHELPDGKECSCSQCHFVRAKRAAIAKATGSSS